MVFDRAILFLTDLKIKDMKTSFLSSSKARMAFMVACLSVFASCSKKYDPMPEPVGDLKILAVNTVSGSTSQDVLVNGVVKASAIAYGSASSYVTITSGVSTIGFYDTGTTTTMNAGGQTQQLPIGAQVSVYYFKLGDGSVTATLFNDATANPATGKAKVRFVHMNSFLSSASGTISVAVDGSTETLVPTIAFGGASNYFEVLPGAKFKFTPAGGAASAAFDGTLIAGKIYTIWIDGTSTSNLTGHVIVSN